jgi:LPXTG-site transpeptidase (sortase) family protein
MATQILIRKTSWLEMAFFLGGIALLTLFSQAWADEGQEADDGSVTQHPVWIQDPYSGENFLTYVREPDYSLWNAARIEDYEESIQVEASPPLGVLTIDAVNIQVPIYTGTEEFNLNRGAGRVKGMARMDEDGNLAISSHRDGFFRGLKDIKVGDEILVQTTKGVEIYEVSSVTIVPKEDISPLDPTTEKTLTLITCYPFYFVGHAPKRWIVKATPKYS